MSLVEDLRAQAFYAGQILRCRELPGVRAEVLSLPDLVERVPRLQNSTLEKILPILGYEEVYAAHLGVLQRALPSDGSSGRDAVLVAPWSSHREIAWKLVCLFETIDEGKRCLILCPNRDAAEAAKHHFQEMLERADITYGLEVVGVFEESQFALLEQSAPQVAFVIPETLRLLLHGKAHVDARETVLSALGRVALPSLEKWPAPMASHVAYLLREVHAECAVRGVSPALVGTVSSGLKLRDFLTDFWGRSIEGGAFIEKDSVESPAIDFVNYTGGLVRQGSRWVRQGQKKVADELLRWLTGEHGGGGREGLELHYVLDVSGSMSNRLESVVGAVIADVERRAKEEGFGGADRIKLTTFDHEAQEIFSEPWNQEAVAAISDRLRDLEASGGTDIAKALGTALTSTIEGEAQALQVLLFSDGYSSATSEERAELLRLGREARVAGRSFRLLYVMLDMEPPVETRNLVRAMGGEIRKQATDELSHGGALDMEGGGLGHVVMISSERGLPESIIQPFQAGLRPVVFTRDVSQLKIDPMDVAAVVASGRFRSTGELLEQIGHLGREGLPVFLLTEAEAWTQLLVEEFPECGNLLQAPLVHPGNSEVRRMRLLEAVGDREVDLPMFRYLYEGAAAWPRFVESLGPVAGSGTAHAARMMTAAPGVTPGLETVKRDRGWRVRAVNPQEPDRFPLETYSDAQIRVEGEGVSRVHDIAFSPLVFHPGAVVDGSRASAEVSGVRGGRVTLVARSEDRHVPLLDSVDIRPVDPEKWEADRRTIRRLGEVCQGEVEVELVVSGVRRFRDGNLEENFSDERKGEGDRVKVSTEALSWRPLGAESNPNLIPGLAGLIRLSAHTLFRAVDDTVLIFSGPEQETIWIIDLAPGGNGASGLLYRDEDLLRSLLALGGRLALDCPCEGGLAGASTAEEKDPDDSGCPRCTRVAGPVTPPCSTAGVKAGSKRQILEWLLENRFLPASSEMHLKEKYEGIHDPLRISGVDRGSRRALLPLVRRIVSDRLGLELEDSDLARFVWLEPGGDRVGEYHSGDNTLRILEGLPEWKSLDVCAHEFFHNLQHKSHDLFDHSALGHQAEPKVPFDGKLLIEGSAMWAESHVVDALAIRTSLDEANLRQGDEYGVGFQLIKYIEESFGGVQAVLEFLSSGDITSVSGGEVKDLNDLFARVGLQAP